MSGKSIEKMNRSFNKRDIQLRNLYFGNIISGFISSGKYNPDEIDKMHDEAIEVAIRSVYFIKNRVPGETNLLKSIRNVFFDEPKKKMY